MGRLDDRQIQDGNISLPDLAHYNWKIIQYTASGLPTKISGTKISGDMDLYVIKDIFRDQNDVPYRVIDSLYNKSDNSLRWQKDNSIIRIDGVFSETSGTIIGEDGD